MTTSQLKFYKGFFKPFYDIVEKEFPKFSKEITRKNDPIFNAIIKAAFTKCYEFNYLNSRSKNFQESFFLMATLRGICEELITIKYLKSLSEENRNNLVQSNFNDDFIKNLLVQEAFFKSYNPGQITINTELFASKTAQNHVKNKPSNKRKAIDKGYLIYPTVSEMAEKSGYKYLYDFLYYATSIQVHFRPDNLLKLGWNKKDEDIKEDIFYYSVKNYYPYYISFCLMYGSLLFCEFVDNFGTEAGISEYLKSETKYFRKSFKLFHWPEIMSHEHLNIKSPSEYERIIKRGLHL